jgi:hypothetical protein
MTALQRARELRLAAQALRDALKAVEFAVERAQLPTHPIAAMMAAERLAEELDRTAAGIEGAAWHA